MLQVTLATVKKCAENSPGTRLKMLFKPQDDKNTQTNWNEMCYGTSSLKVKEKGSGSTFDFHHALLPTSGHKVISF